MLEKNRGLYYIDPVKYKHLKDSIDFSEALEYARDWWPQRTWLLEQKVKIASFPEELRFQMYCRNCLNKRKEEYEELKGLKKAIELKVYATNKQRR